MNHRKAGQVLLIVGLLLVLAVSLVSSLSTYPSRPTSIQVDGNSTGSYPNGTMLNGTRGYIYYLTINESQPTQKWVGYVGEINGYYALQDAAAKALYDWSIVTVTGELYATREGPTPGAGAGYDIGASNQGGIPDWSNIRCANQSIITREGINLNHTATDEDSYTNTFRSGATFVNPGFFVGEVYVGDTNTSGGGGTCYGVNLLINSTHANEGVSARNWTQVVLTDRTGQWWDDSNNLFIYDIVYAALLQNNSMAFDGTTKDFQIMLPQSGLLGDQPNIAYYFYVELV